MDVFRRFDADQDGHLTLAELSDGLVKAHSSLTPPQVSALFQHMNQKGGDRISFDVFSQDLQYCPVHTSTDPTPALSANPTRTMHVPCGCLSKPNNASSRSILPKSACVSLLS